MIELAVHADRIAQPCVIRSHTMVTGVAVRGPIGESVYPDLVIDYTIDVDCLLISPKPDHPISPWFCSNSVSDLSVFDPCRT